MSQRFEKCLAQSLLNRVACESSEAVSMKEELDVLSSPSLTVHTVSVDVSKATSFNSNSRPSLDKLYVMFVDTWGGGGERRQNEVSFGIPKI